MPTHRFLVILVLSHNDILQSGYSFAQWHQSTIIMIIYNIVPFLLSDCGIISPPENGSISFMAGIQGNTSFNAIATYECASGLTLTSSAKRTCSETLEWVPAAPNCTRGKVTLLRTILNHFL